MSALEATWPTMFCHHSLSWLGYGPRVTVGFEYTFFQIACSSCRLPPCEQYKLNGVSKVSWGRQEWRFPEAAEAVSSPVFHNQRLKYKLYSLRTSLAVQWFRIQGRGHGFNPWSWIFHMSLGQLSLEATTTKFCSFNELASIYHSVILPGS